MLEHEGVLWTWQLFSDPTTAGDVAIEAVRIGDHRLHYLDYEGPVSGNRGQVRRADRGSVRHETRESGFVRLELDGVRLCGSYCLTRRADEHWIWAPASSAP